MEAEVELFVIARDPMRDVVEWLETVVGHTIAYDHATRSPACKLTAMEYCKIVAPKDQPIGSQPTPQ